MVNVYLVVRFTRAKYYTRCGPLRRPTPACTYESSVHLVTSIISPNLDQVILYLAHRLPSVFTLWKLFQYFNRRISWFFGNFLLHHPPKFPSFSHVAILRAYVRPQMTTDFPEPLYITQKLTLTVKRIKAVKECGQHPCPLPASPHSHSQQCKLVKSMPIKLGR